MIKKPRSKSSSSLQTTSALPQVNYYQPHVYLLKTSEYKSNSFVSFSCKKQQYSIHFCNTEMYAQMLRVKRGKKKKRDQRKHVSTLLLLPFVNYKRKGMSRASHRQKHCHICPCPSGTLGAPPDSQIWAFNTMLAVIALPWNSVVHQHSQS